MSQITNMMDKLAEAEVGRPGSPLVFVTIGGVVRAVFTQRSDLDAAKSFAIGRARALRHGRSGKYVVVEDETGVVWDSATDRY